MNVWTEALRHLSASAPDEVRRAIVDQAMGSGALLFQREGRLTFLAGDPAAPTLLVTKAKRLQSTIAIYNAAHSPNNPRDVTYLLGNKVPIHRRRDYLTSRFDRVIAWAQHDCTALAYALDEGLHWWVDKDDGRCFIVYRTGRVPAIVKQTRNSHGTMADGAGNTQDAALDNA